MLGLWRQPFGLSAQRIALRAWRIASICGRSAFRRRSSAFSDNSHYVLGIFFIKNCKQTSKNALSEWQPKKETAQQTPLCYNKRCFLTRNKNKKPNPMIDVEQTTIIFHLHAWECNPPHVSPNSKENTHYPLFSARWWMTDLWPNIYFTRGTVIVPSINSIGAF